MSLRLPSKIAAALAVTLVPLAAQADYVNQILVCSSNLYMIQMQTAGWVYVYVPDVGQDQANRMMSAALSMLATRKQAGYFNNSGAASLQCGVQAKEITVLAVTATP